MRTFDRGEELRLALRDGAICVSDVVVELPIEQPRDSECFDCDGAAGAFYTGPGGEITPVCSTCRGSGKALH